MLACKLCIALHGLSGKDISKLPETEEELMTHIEKEHHITVRREGETREQAVARCRKLYPDAPPADEHTMKVTAALQGKTLTEFVVEQGRKNA